MTDLKEGWVRTPIGDLADDDVHRLQLRPDELENRARGHESRLTPGTRGYMGGPEDPYPEGADIEGEETDDPPIIVEPF